MATAQLSALAGWLSAAACVGALLLGVTLRRLPSIPPRLRRMRPHYTLGYVALTLMLIHLGATMGLMRGASSSGLWFATAAMFALIAQVLIGATLTSATTGRRTLHRNHAIVAALLVITTVGHVALNGPLVAR